MNETEKMYDVVYAVTGTAIVRVKANSEEEARKKARSGPETMELEDWQTEDIVDVCEV